MKTPKQKPATLRDVCESLRLVLVEIGSLWTQLDSLVCRFGRERVRITNVCVADRVLSFDGWQHDSMPAHPGQQVRITYQLANGESEEERWTLQFPAIVHYDGKVWYQRMLCASHSECRCGHYEAFHDRSSVASVGRCTVSGCWCHSFLSAS